MTGLSNREDLEALVSALAEIGRDAKARQAIIDALNTWEQGHQADGDNIRDRVTGPVTDALHTNIPQVERTLRSGLKFALQYSSKIAREFAMAPEPLTHVWEPQTTRLLLALAEKASTVVVGGAYAGDQAVPMASVMRARAGAMVHCFELNPVQIKALKENAARNGLTNIAVNPVGLWDKAGFVELQGSDSHAAPVSVPAATANSFPVTTITDYAREHNIADIDLIMLDVEGGEPLILAGADKFLAAPKEQAPDVVFEIHSSYVDWSKGLDSTPIVSGLRKHGYDVYGLRDFQGHLNLDEYPLELVELKGAYIEGPPHGFNMFATKRPETLARIGAVIRTGVSPKLLRHRLSAVHQPSKAPA